MIAALPAGDIRIRGGWYAHPVATPFWLLPASQRVQAVPSQVRPVISTPVQVHAFAVPPPSQRRWPLRGLGADLFQNTATDYASTGVPSPGSVSYSPGLLQSILDYESSIPAGSLPTAQQATAASAAAGLPTSWFTTPILGGIPGWGLLALGVLGFVMLSSMGGRRR